MKKLDICYEDKELLIVNKPSKLLTIQSAKEKENTLYQMASEYVKKKHPKNKVFIVNRLDRDTSGLVVFAKNEALKKSLQENWQESAPIREYLAIVENKMSGSGTLTSYLKEDKTLRVYSTKKKSKDLAITHYEVIDANSQYSLLKIQIETGKKNQIRVQLSDLSHPIIGDKKYGSIKNPIGRLGLHASFLKLKYHHQWLFVTAKIPNEMKRLFPEKIIAYEKEGMVWKDSKK